MEGMMDQYDRLDLQADQYACKTVRVSGNDHQQSLLSRTQVRALIRDAFREGRLTAPEDVTEQHWLLSRTRNGQQLWDGPASSLLAAQGRQERLLAPWSVVVSGRVARGPVLRTAPPECPHASEPHTSEWCGCTCPEL